MYRHPPQHSSDTDMVVYCCLKCIKTAADPPSSDQAEALVLLHSLSETAAQDLFGLVAGHVEQVVAGVSHRQVVLLRCGGLDDDAQAFHAVDGDTVAPGQEHCRQETRRR